MQKIHWLTIYPVAFLLATCSSSKETAGVSKHVPGGISFQKILFVVASADIQERVRLENDLLATATSEGYSAVKSLDVIPFSLNEPKIPVKEEIDLKAKENGCDAVLIASLSRKEEVVNVIEGTTINANNQMLAGILGSILNKGGHAEPVAGVYKPASYSHEKGYFIIQSFLYDVASGTIIYSAQSPNFEISSLDKIRKGYTTTLIAQLEKEKLLKK
jgi:hypothetical protein